MDPYTIFIINFVVFRVNQQNFLQQARAKTMPRLLKVKDIYLYCCFLSSIFLCVIFEYFKINN